MKLPHKFILVVITGFLFILSFNVSAQTIPDLKISDIQSIYDINHNWTPRSTSLKAGEREYFSVMIQPIQEVSALFQNSGKKTVKAITWEYIIYADEPHTEVVEVYTSSKKISLPPGDSVRLSKSGFINIGFYENVRVLRVEYADGTFLQGAKTKK